MTLPTEQLFGHCADHSAKPESAYRDRFLITKIYCFLWHVGMHASHFHGKHAFRGQKTILTCYTLPRKFQDSGRMLARMAALVRRACPAPVLVCYSSRACYRSHRV